MKIYTKTGDKGETSLFSGKRVPKNHALMEAIGTVDECNSTIGMVIAFLPAEKTFDEIRRQLIIIQHALFDLGAAVATPRTQSSEAKIKKTRFDEEELKYIEKWIDQMDAALDPLKTFILPGGHPAGATLHLARSICRRAERTIAPLAQQKDVSENILIYLNRLSDYLFMASRLINHQLKNPEITWEKHLNHE